MHALLFSPGQALLLLHLNPENVDRRTTRTFSPRLQADRCISVSRLETRSAR